MEGGREGRWGGGERWREGGEVGMRGEMEGGRGGGEIWREGGEVGRGGGEGGRGGGREGRWGGGEGGRGGGEGGRGGKEEGREEYVVHSVIYLNQIDFLFTFFLLTIVTVHVKKNATNMPRRH